MLMSKNHLKGAKPFVEKGATNVKGYMELIGSRAATTGMDLGKLSFLPKSSS
jgi:hypothetical protein